MRSVDGVWHAAWHQRRWLYGAYMCVALLRIPARTGFHLVMPACDTRITFPNVALSITKVPHVVLFGLFFLVTVLQFSRVNGRVVTASLLATAALGLVVELEEGATRTGNCRLTDVVPDLLGALVVMTVVLVLLRSRVHHMKGRAT